MAESTKIPSFPILVATYFIQYVIFRSLRSCLSKYHGLPFSNELLQCLTEYQNTQATIIIYVEFLNLAHRSIFDVAISKMILFKDEEKRTTIVQFVY